MADSSALILEQDRAMNESGTKREAIYFFEGIEISKEMTHAEFEAVLDGYVGMTDFAGSLLNAAFVMIGPQLNITGMCFFTIGFDGDGHADPSWNIPLRSICDKTGLGPDLGFGRFKLATQSLADAGSYREQLWDPDPICINALVERVAENRLCLTVESSQPAMNWQAAPAPAAMAATGDASIHALEAEHQSQLAHLVLEQREQVAALTSESAAQLRQANHSHEKDLSLANFQADKLRRDFDKLQTDYIELNRQLEDERRTHRQLAAQFESAKMSMKQQVHKEVDELTKSLADEAKALRVKMKLKDEEVVQMREELMQLRKDKLRLTEQGGGKFLQRLQELGINFIAFHPGAGHLSIPLESMSDYMENPIEFAAQKCKVSVEQYRVWLAHYERPECQAPITNDRNCGCKIPKADSPAKFVVGKSDRCDKHKVHDVSSAPIKTSSIQ